MANGACIGVFDPAGTGILTGFFHVLSAPDDVMNLHSLQLDHLVIAARTLDEGARFIAEKLGVETAEGGAHPLMRTHNRLLNLWGGAYLEVLAINPDAAPIDSPRPRLFAMDERALHARLENGPQLVHWVARVDRPKSLARWQSQYPERIAPIVAMTRGSNTWNLTVSDDGAFPSWQGAGDGLLPSLIQWDTPRHPSETLPETGIALKSLTGFHPRANLLSEQLAWLGASHLMGVEVTEGIPTLVAEFELPDGSIVTIGQSMESAKPDESVEAAKRSRKRGKSEASADKESVSEAAKNANGREEPDLPVP